jgi:hypothetical protein
MRLELAFRLSTYLSLACAAACLGYAEESFLPGIGAFVGLIGVLLVVTFFLERRWALRPLAANLLGLLIFAGTGLWIASSLFWPSGDSLRQSAQWPASLLPYVGPLLMILVLAKLMRPKHAGDYWTLQGMGVLQVALGCALSNDPWDSNLVFGLLLLAYLSCGLWWLVLFYPARGQAAKATATTGPGKPPWRWLGLGQAARWFTATMALGIVLFLTTPRSGLQPFLLTAPTSSHMQTGYSPENIDLTRTGRVEINNEVAVIVTAAEDVGPSGVLRRPKLDLDVDQLWRGATLHDYSPSKGRWQARPTDQTVAPPQLDPSLRYYLVYALNPSQVHGTVLADPVLDVVTLTSEGEAEAGSWIPNKHGTWMPLALPSGTKFSYREATIGPAPERGLSPPVAVHGAEMRLRHYWKLNDPPPYERKPPEKHWLKEWTTELLRRLAAEGRYGLTAKDLETEEEHERRTGGPRPLRHGERRFIGHGDGSSLLPKNYEKVARALSEYLATTGDYVYTLDLRRQDPDKEPLEDFLLNTKQGHCERFATALALMLRTQGIPTQLVVGFHGAEARGDGVYYVRHSQAHSWVEALVWRADPAPGHYHWLTLDPTPAGEAIATGDSAGSSWADTWDKLQRLWRDSVIGYHPTQLQNVTADLSDRLDLAASFQETAGSVREQLRSLHFWAWCAAVVTAALLLSRWYIQRVRRRRTPGAIAARMPAVAFYARLLAILERHMQLRPQAHETPDEFAGVVAPVLARATTDGSLAALLRQIVRLFYRVRYGQHGLTTAEQHGVEQQLDRMDAALAKPRIGAPQA